MKNINLALAAAALSCLLVACGGSGSGSGSGGGGGGGGGGTGDVALRGLAATGAAIANGAVAAHCTSGPEIRGTTGADGIFDLQLTPSHTLPCMLRVIGGAPHVTLYSFTNESGRVNISPVTDLIVTRALGTEPSAVFSAFNSSNAAVVNGALVAAKVYVRTQMELVTGGRLLQDPISGSFSVGDADDSILDALASAMSASGKAIADLRQLASTGSEISSAVPPVNVLGTPRQFYPTTSPRTLERSIAALLDDNTTLIFSSYGLANVALPISLLRLSSNGELLETIKVSNSANAFLPQIQADQIGGAFIAWRQSRVVNGDSQTEVHVRRYDRNTGLGAEIQLDTGIAGEDRDFQLSVRPNGSATIAWVRSPTQLGPRGGHQYAIFVSEYTVGAGWSSGSRLSEFSDDEFSNVRVASSPNGNVMAMWTERTPVILNPDSPSTISVLGKLVARFKAAGAAWKSAAVVEDDRSSWQNSNRFSSVQLSIGNSGNAMVIWKAGDRGVHNDGQYGLKINRFDANTGWLGTEIFSISGISPVLAMNANGQGFVSWTEPGNGVFDPAKLFAARFNESGFQGQAARVDQSNSPYSGGVILQLPIDDVGNAVAIFASSKDQGTSNEIGVIRVSRYTAANGWSTNSVIPPYNALGLFSTATNVSGGKATAIFNIGDFTGGRSVAMMLNFTVAR